MIYQLGNFHLEKKKITASSFYTFQIITLSQNRTECVQNESRVQRINCLLLLGRWYNSAVYFFVVECQCDLKLLTAPDAYTALGSCCLSPSIDVFVSMDMTLNLFFSCLSPSSSANHSSVHYPLSFSSCFSSPQGFHKCG